MATRSNTAVRGASNASRPFCSIEGDDGTRSTVVDSDAGDTSEPGPLPIKQVQVLYRAFDILDRLVGDRASWSLTELARSANLPKSTVHRLAGALCARGLLWRDPADDRYRLGPLALKIGQRALAQQDLLAIARPVMRELADTTGETVVLATLTPARDAAIYVEQIPSSHGIRLVAEVGVRMPLHAGGISRALLAWLGADDVARVLDGLLEPLARGTITDKARLRASLADARHRGHTISFEETCDGACGMGVPIFDHDARVIASLGVAGPVSRLSPPDRWSDAARTAAERIAARIGGSAAFPGKAGGPGHDAPSRSSQRGAASEPLAGTVR